MATYRTSQGRRVRHCHTPGKYPCFRRDFTPAQLERKQQWMETHFPNVEEVSPPTRTYNCFGYSFAESHGVFEETQAFIEDDFEELDMEDAKVGDVILYRKEGELRHGAIVTRVQNGRIRELRSKFGRLAVVLHQLHEVPDVYGPPSRLLRPRPAEELKV